MDKIKLAELIGILLGDGCIGKYVTHIKDKIKIQHRVKITLDSNVDKEYTPHVKKLVDDLLKVNSLIRKRKGENTIDILTFKKHAFDYLINKVRMKISPKRNNALIPKEFEKGKLGLMVLRGYFDTDGALVITNNHGTVYPRIEMKVCPSPMIKQFSQILQENKFRFGIYKIINNEVRIQINGVEQIIKWKKLIGSSNPKHIKKFKKFWKNNSGDRI